MEESVDEVRVHADHCGGVRAVAEFFDACPTTIRENTRETWILIENLQRKGSIDYTHTQMIGGGMWLSRRGEVDGYGRLAHAASADVAVYEHDALDSALGYVKSMIRSTAGYASADEETLDAIIHAIVRAALSMPANAEH